MDKFSKDELIKIIEYIEIKDMVKGFSDEKLTDSFNQIREEGIRRIKEYNIQANIDFRNFLLNHLDVIEADLRFTMKQMIETLSVHRKDDVLDDYKPLLSLDFKWNNKDIHVNYIMHEFGSGLEINGISHQYSILCDDLYPLLKNRIFIPNCEGIRYVDYLPSNHIVYKFLELIFPNLLNLNCKVKNLSWPFSENKLEK